MILHGIHGRFVLAGDPVNSGLKPRSKYEKLEDDLMYSHPDRGCEKGGPKCTACKLDVCWKDMCRPHHHK